MLFIIYVLLIQNKVQTIQGVAKVFFSFWLKAGCFGKKILSRMSSKMDQILSSVSFRSSSFKCIFPCLQNRIVVIKNVSTERSFKTLNGWAFYYNSSYSFLLPKLLQKNNKKKMCFSSTKLSSSQIALKHYIIQKTRE